MGNTKIQWTDKVWNPVTGCTPVSPGCQNCYAKRMANRLKGRYGYPADDPFQATLHPDRLSEPCSWRKPRRVFVASMGDLFHKDVPIWAIDGVLSVAALCERHVFMVLTKRPERMAEYFARPMSHAEIDQQAFERNRDFLGGSRDARQWKARSWPLPNLWLGVTCENQGQADRRIPILLGIPAAVRFVSVEPMLGPVDLTATQHDGMVEINSLNGDHGVYRPLRGKSDVHLNWVISGCESGPHRRPAQLDWFRSLRDQCQAAGVPFFLKQMDIDGRLVKMPELDGRVWAELPRS